MKTITKIVVLTAMLATGCNTALEQPDQGRAQVMLVPSAFGVSSSPSTRAVDFAQTAPGGTDPYYNQFTGEPDIIDLPVGAVLWVVYSQGTIKSAYSSYSEDEKLEHPEYFDDGVHPNELGNRVIAEHIQNEIAF